MSTSPEWSSRTYSAYLAQLLRNIIGVELPHNFENIFLSHAARVGTSNFEDLGSLIVLECIEVKSHGIDVNSDTLNRIIDRVRHRIARGIRREVQSNYEPADPRRPVPDKLDLREFFEIAKAQLSPLHVLLFEQHYLDGRRIDDLAAELGLSKSTAYRMTKDIKNALINFLNKNN
jgi:hypothetical protein